MRAKEVVVSRREGANVYYRLGSTRISVAYIEMHRFAVEYLAAQTELLTE